MKKIIRNLFKSFGYELRRLTSPAPIGSVARPVDNHQTFLEDLNYRGFSPQSILDVGAHKGDWSRTAKSIFPTARCFLVEPQEEMIPFMETFSQDFTDSKWFLAGAGANLGQLTLTVWDDFAGSSFLPSESAELRTLGKQRTIPIITIDSLLDNNQITLPQLVKLDIQGFELEALKGGSKLFGNTEVFILEVSLFPFLKVEPIFNEVVSFMYERNYVVYDFAGFCRRP